MEDLDWLFTQDYKGEENQVTEALFKWFFFSRLRVQKAFLTKVCKVPIKKALWRGFDLQKKGRRGTPDAVVTLADGSQLLVEVKIKEKTVSTRQVIRHLRDAHLGKKVNGRIQRPVLVLVTPEMTMPEKLAHMHDPYKKAVTWVPWLRVIKFLSKELKKGLNSADQLLRLGLRDFLKKHPKISRCLPY
jgi:hypothetical protein